MKFLVHSKHNATPVYFYIFAGVKSRRGVTKTQLRSCDRVHRFFRAAMYPPIPTTHSKNSALDAALYLSSGAYAAC